MDYKEWIAQRAEELAQEELDTDFNNLPNDVQIQLYNKAEEEYVNYEAARIDALYDMMKENEFDKE